MKNPYAQMRKVPLDYNGIQSSAYSVQYQESHDKWKEAGVVGSKYMLLPNSKVKEAADQVANASNIQFEQDKTFFDGRRYVYSLKSNNVVGNIIDRFLDPSKEYHAETSGWGLLNAATDILWHKKKPTLASYNHNAMITDGLIMAATY